jgi:hypothetical protein
MENLAVGKNSLTAFGVTNLTVLGQTYEVAPSVAVVIGAKRYTAAQAIQFIQPGAYVSIAGIESLNGRRQAQEIIVSQRSYVPGASDVFVSGLVTAYDTATGLAQIGSLQIDANASLAADPSLKIPVGSQIDVFGTQAALGGIVWATELKSISGTGASVQSISGTGKSLDSISGTGKSLDSISGTGRSLDSISGTGTSVQSISGTGTSVQSISGTGKSLDSISGTGTSVQSISGTGTPAA